MGLLQKISSLKTEINMRESLGLYDQELDEMKAELNQIIQNIPTVGWVGKENKVGFVTDGNGCYDVRTGNCYCAECFYYGADRVNCRYAGDLSGGIKVLWDGDVKKFVPVE